VRLSPEVRQLRHCSPLEGTRSTGQTTVPQNGSRLVKGKGAMLSNKE
jgi:hypothetical protein